MKPIKWWELPLWFAIGVAVATVFQDKINELVTWVIS